MINKVLPQSCLPDGIEFLAQNQIDSFQINYPGCTEIEADVWIRGDDITNLDALHVLTSIGGYLTISSAPNLTSLSGLNQLNSIGHNFQLNKCHSVIDFTGLEDLTTVVGDIIIWGNDSLVDLTGLDNLDFGLINNIMIYNNPRLNNCNIIPICEYLSNPNGEIIIHHNDTACKNPLAIADNCNITLDCLPYGRYMFFSQPEIDSFPLNYPDCYDLGGRVDIRGYDGEITNFNGLNQILSIAESLGINLVHAEDLSGLEHLSSIGSYLNIQGNSYLKSLAGLNSLTTIGGAVIRSNDSLKNLYGLNNLKVSTGALWIIDNPLLTSLDYLDSLSSVNDGVMIEDNEELLSLDGLHNLLEINDYLHIENNKSLTSLSGIDNIDPELINELLIKYNPLLSACEVKSVCEYLLNQYGYSNIMNNTSGCNTEAEVLSECTVIIPVKPIAEKVMLYPNPADNEIYFSSHKKIEKIIIYNAVGKKVFEENYVIDKINISNLPSGLYSIEIIENGRYIRGTVIIK